MIIQSVYKFFTLYNKQFDHLYVFYFIIAEDTMIRMTSINASANSVMFISHVSISLYRILSFKRSSSLLMVPDMNVRFMNK